MGSGPESWPEPRPRTARCERLIRTPKTNLPWVRTFDTVEQLRQALIEFRGTYNAAWLIERHDFRPPGAIRAE